MKTLRLNFTLGRLMQIACASVATVALAHGQAINFVPIDSAPAQKESGQPTKPTPVHDGETILIGGDVAEITATSVKKIPLSEAPLELQKAMKADMMGH